MLAFQDVPTMRYELSKEDVQEQFADAEFEEFKDVVVRIADNAILNRNVRDLRAHAKELALLIL